MLLPIWYIRQWLIYSSHFYSNKFLYGLVYKSILSCLFFPVFEVHRATGYVIFSCVSGFIVMCNFRTPFSWSILLFLYPNLIAQHTPPPLLSPITPSVLTFSHAHIRSSSSFISLSPSFWTWSRCSYVGTWSCGNSGDVVSVPVRRSFVNDQWLRNEFTVLAHKRSFFEMCKRWQRKVSSAPPLVFTLWLAMWLSPVSI